MPRNIKYIYSDYLIRQADKNPAVIGRASLTHELIASYGLLESMQRVRPRLCNAADLRGFHSRAYVEHLDNYTFNTQPLPTQPSPDDSTVLEEGDFPVTALADSYGLSYDCPPWAGIKDYACAIAGATMTACDLLRRRANSAEADVIINWCGGWHHARRDQAAGFCYVNDIVLGILVLRKSFKRILYIDLDNHHGDAVESAFAYAQRVFTLSFHQLECGYYPGSGRAEDCGRGSGKGYAANFPYKRSISGDNYCKYFKRISSQIFAVYQPDVCVVQCGADVIVGDPLGGTNLVPNDLVDCIDYVLKRGTPVLLLGGGGYNFANSSRFWCSLTAAVCGKELAADIPDDNTHFLAYGPDYSLHLQTEKCIKDLNSDSYLEETARLIEENLEKYQVKAV